MFGTIYTAGLIVLISSTCSIITIEGLSNWFLGIIFTLLFPFLLPFALIVKLLIKATLGDDLELFINRIYWSLCIIFIFLINPIFKIANWNGGLKTTIASLLILLIYFVMNKIISVVKENDINEINSNIESIEFVGELAEVNIFLSSLFKAITATILIILSTLILKLSVIGTNYVKNIIYNKDSNLKYEYIDTDASKNQANNEIDSNIQTLPNNEKDLNIETRNNTERIDDTVKIEKPISNNIKFEVSNPEPKISQEEYWNKRRIESIEGDIKSLEEKIKEAQKKIDQYPKEDAYNPLRGEQEGLIKVYQQELEEYKKQLNSLKK